VTQFKFENLKLIIDVFLCKGDESMVCEPEHESVVKVELKVNGEDVALNDFVKGFVSETLTGMVKSLRGVGEVKTISLEISKVVSGK
jgi:outer membrane lipoprotein-sorting protein